MRSLTPKLAVAHDYLMRENDNDSVKTKWNDLRAKLDEIKFGTCVKRHCLSKKAIEDKGIKPTVIELFLIMYTVHLAETYLGNTLKQPFFAIGNFCGNKTKSPKDLPLDNLFMKQPLQTATQVTNMKDLRIDDQTKTPISLTSIALALFTVNNTPLLCTSSIQAKFECINNYTKDTVDTTIMKIDPSKKTMIKRKKKKAKVQEKKSDNVSTDVPPSTSNPHDNDATVQSPTTSDTVIEEPQSTTSKNDSNPPNTTIQSSSTSST